MTQPDPGTASASAPSGGWARTRPAGRSVAAAALLPLRLFLGITYVYAAIDKFASPHFFTADSPFSVAAQMEGFTAISPLAPLIEAAMPAAIPIGALIAIGELGIGIGVLTGLAYGLAAWAGVAFSLLFWLTASWSSSPYFYSPDLPYAFGFLTLALAGHGHLLVIDPFPKHGHGGEADDAAADAGPEAMSGDMRVADAGPSSTRRALLQAGILAALTVFTAGALTRLRALSTDQAATSGGAPGAGSTPAPTAAHSPGPAAVATAAATAAPSAGSTAGMAPSTSPSGAPPSTPSASATVAPTVAATPAVTAAAGPVIASVADLAPNTGIPFTVPTEAPFAQNPGGPGVLVQLADGRFVAYSARCTHGQCTVAYDSTVSELVCPCHLGRFDAANAAAVLGGPPPLPLAGIPLAVDESGQIHVVLDG